MNDRGVIREMRRQQRAGERVERAEAPAVSSWTDHSAVSTIVGWSAFTTKHIFYSRTGRLVYVQFFIDGTSNSVNTSFTLPYTAAPDISVIDFHQARDNGGTPVQGVLQVVALTDVVNLYSTAGAAAWTASGTKQARGQFFYTLTA